MRIVDVFGVDRFDENAAARDDLHKTVQTPSLDAEVAFGRAATSIAEFVRLGGDAIATSETFYSAGDRSRSGRDYHYHKGLLRFASPLETEHEPNNWVSVRVYERRHSRGAVVILPHWNAAPDAYHRLGVNLRRIGFTVAVPTLPFHGQRSLPSEPIAHSFLSASLGKTVRSVRQAVLDTSAIIDWLAGRDHGKIAVAGASLGSCVAGLVAAHDERVKAAALLLTAGDFAEVVWSGRATRHLRQSFDGYLALNELKHAWRIISTQSFAARLARPGLRLLILSAGRDRVVVPALTTQFIATLRQLGCEPQFRQIDCGHYSLATVPFNVLAFITIGLFLRNNLQPPRDGPI